MPSAKEWAERDKYLASSPCWKLTDTIPRELTNVKLAHGEEPVAIYANADFDPGKYTVIFTSMGIHANGQFCPYREIEQVLYPMCPKREFIDPLKRNLVLKTTSGQHITVYFMGEVRPYMDLPSAFSFLTKLILFSKKW